MQTNQQEEEVEDDCTICNESLPKLSSNFMRMICCGNGMHIKCFDGIKEVSSLSDKQKGSCLLCRTKYSKSNEEHIVQLHPWVEKGIAWAQSMLGCKYRDGVGVDQSYQHARELFELAASQGEADAQSNLGCLYANGQGVEQSNETARALCGLKRQSKDTRVPLEISITLTNTKEEQHPRSHHPNDAPPATHPRHPPTN